MVLIVTHRIFDPNVTQCMIFSAVHETVYKTDSILGTNQVLSKPKRIIIISIVFSQVTIVQ